jgi:alpha-galactosidase
MNSRWTGAPSVIYGNVRNDGLITSLPTGCAVEVPCLVDHNGIQPTYVGDLPPQLTALIRTNVNVQELTVQALLTENREHIYHAAMMDPHTAAELDLDQIWALVDELLVAHDRWLPDWARMGTKVAAE